MILKLIFSCWTKGGWRPKRIGQYRVVPNMIDPQSLRRIALKLLSMALDDTNPHFVRALVTKAIEHLNQAHDLEASSTLPRRPSCDASETE